ncbi:MULTISPECIES: MBL fold metallo-hydrolase [unclassified Agarivorans]|uniref:MBL fold metallo-hydrolase n=1 Tax=unclassified Agarivorans TaxID=2636026 RepID=UPI003D7CC9FA
MSKQFKNNHIPAIEKNPLKFFYVRYFGEPKWADQAAQAADIPRQSVDSQLINRVDEATKITWLGHSSFLIQVAGVNFLTDPVFSERVSPMSFAGPKRLVPLTFDLEDLPNIDFVLISHNHYDHLDENTIKHLGNRTNYFVPEGLKPWFEKQGIDAQRVNELAWWDHQTFGAASITATPSQHWSGRGVFDRNKTHWASWLIELGGKRLWFAGDTGYNPYDFKEIGQWAGEIDVALIPIGAYSPRGFMKDQHVDVAEAIKVHQDVRSKLSIGMHWGTYPLTAEPVMEPAELLDKLTQTQLDDNSQFIHMAIGETRVFERE